MSIKFKKKRAGGGRTLSAIALPVVSPLVIALPIITLLVITLPITIGIVAVAVLLLVVEVEVVVVVVGSCCCCCCYCCVMWWWLGVDVLWMPLWLDVVAVESGCLVCLG